MSSSRSLALSLLAGVLSAALLGCAAQVPADNAASAGASARSGSQPPVAGNASTATAQASAAGSTATGGLQAPPEVLTSQTLHQAEELGYSPETRNGTTVFCKQQQPDIGSRLTVKREQCVDQKSIAALVERQQQQQQKLQNCSGTGCSQ